MTPGFLQAREQTGQAEAQTLGDKLHVKNGYISPAAFDISQETSVNSYLLSHFDLSPTALLPQLANALSQPDEKVFGHHPNLQVMLISYKTCLRNIFLLHSDALGTRIVPDYSRLLVQRRRWQRYSVGLLANHETRLRNFRSPPPLNDFLRSSCRPGDRTVSQGSLPLDVGEG